ncbi:MAG: FlgD immunoglobulin-like domain containing protein, partial [Calditrichia bacterium]
NNIVGNGKLNALNAVQNTPDGGGSGTPVEAGKLIAGDGAPDEYFGNAVAVNGDYAVVGAHFDDDNGWGSGSAYVFHWNGTNWTQEAKLIGSNTSSYDFFGSSVAIDGEIAIIGAPGDAVGGAAYVFRRTGVTWNQETILTASDAASNDNFGTAVSLSGDTALVGAPGDYLGTGAAYIFKRNGGNWTELTKLTANDGVALDHFGSSVAIEGETAVAGAKDHYANGAVYVFGVDGNSWELEAQLTASDGSAGDMFGASISLNGNTIVVGARFDDDNGLDSGSAYVFRKQGNSWNEEAKLTPIDGAADDRFGMVAVKGGVVLVGATHDDDNGLDSGAAYVFTRNGTDWSQLAKVLPGDGHAGDWFGSSVVLGYQHFLVGSPYDNDNGSDSGSAYVFDFTVTVIHDGLNPFAAIPGKFVLYQNYPNPFNPSTTIRYQLPRSSEVALDIYNLLGQKIESLVDGWQAPGEYHVQWDGRSEKGTVVSSGIYIYRLKVNGGIVKSRRMILMK